MMPMDDKLVTGDRKKIDLLPRSIFKIEKCGQRQKSDRAYL
jgi:hypothetical protein